MYFFINSRICFPIDFIFRPYVIPNAKMFYFVRVLLVIFILAILYFMLYGHIISTIWTNRLIYYFTTIFAYHNKTVFLYLLIILYILNNTSANTVVTLIRPLQYNLQKLFFYGMIY